MSRRCIITHKGVQTGNNVSHANNRTRRRFLPNLKKINFFSGALQTDICLRVSMHGFRTVEQNGGIDGYLQKTSLSRLDPSLQQYKKQIDRLKEAQA